jgi:hypothetical protein
VIVVDTSAIVAILNDEPDSERCVEAIGRETVALLSAANYVESALVASRCSQGSSAISTSCGHCSGPRWAAGSWSSQAAPPVPAWRIALQRALAVPSMLGRQAGRRAWIRR